MDIFRPKRNRKFILVYKKNMRVLDDYIQTLMMFDEIIESSDFDSSKFQNTNDIVVFTQMWLSLDSNVEVLTNPRFIFLNVENLTEHTRYKHVMDMIDMGVRIADYSVVNIEIITTISKRIAPNTNIL